MKSLKKVLTSRKLIFIVLVLVLIFLSGFYVLNYQQHLENPNTGVILKNYPIGETVAVSGIVTDVQTDGFTLSDNFQGTKVSYTIFSSVKVSNGDQVEVLGVLGNSYQITASKILVVSSFDYNFLLVRSAIAFLIFLYFFRLYWRFDFNKMEFRRVK